MKVVATSIPDVLIIETAIHGDSRGFFVESFNQRDFNAATGTDYSFVQDCHSRSKKGVLRGLHYQLMQPQGKLLRVLRGSVFDVVVDIRRVSPTFGKWVGLELSENSNLQVWVPPGLAHGFLTLSDNADLFYKTTDYYAPTLEHCIAWDDPDLAIDWPTQSGPMVSKKDRTGTSFLSAHLEGDGSIKC